MGGMGFVFIFFYDEEGVKGVLFCYYFVILQ